MGTDESGGFYLCDVVDILNAPSLLSGHDRPFAYLVAGLASANRGDSLKRPDNAYAAG